MHPDLNVLKLNPRRRADRRSVAQLSVLLALLLAARALVPVGYMLGVSSAGGLDLSLCPLQNPGLDLSRLAPALLHATDHEHGVHAGAQGGMATESSMVASAADCGAWVSSLSVAGFAPDASYPARTPAAGLPPAAFLDLSSPSRYGGSSPRAPPADALSS